MKKIIQLLLVFLSISTFTFADFDFFDYYWDGNDANLYFNINLSSQLQFDDTYRIFNINDGACCELACRPVDGEEILSSEGYQLNKLKVRVKVTNMDDLIHVNCEMRSIATYKGLNDEGNLVTVTETHTMIGTIENSPLDASQEPSFYTIDDLVRQGVVQFKNL